MQYRKQIIKIRIIEYQALPDWECKNTMILKIVILLLKLIIQVLKIVMYKFKLINYIEIQIRYLTAGRTQM